MTSGSGKESVVSADAPTDAKGWKDKGNELYKQGNLDEALDCYSRALSFFRLSPPKSDTSSGSAGDVGQPKAQVEESSVILKNRAQVYLKLENYEACVEDCESALKLTPGDAKALFRKAMACEKLGKLDEAYKDGKAALAVDPNNKAIKDLMQNLYTALQAKAEYYARTGNKVAEMMTILTSDDADVDKRKKAVSNLLVLSRESSGAEFIWKENLVPSLITAANKSASSCAAAGKSLSDRFEMTISVIRILSELCKGNPDRTKGVLRVVGLPWLFEHLHFIGTAIGVGRITKTTGLTDEERAKKKEQELEEEETETLFTATEYCFQTIMDTLCGKHLTFKRDEKSKYLASHEVEIDSVMAMLLSSCAKRTLSAKGRDAILELLMKNVDASALDWSMKFVERGGIQRLLEIASELPDYRFESSMEVTDSTSTLVAVTLGKVYENMYYDKARQEYLAKVDDFVKDQLMGPDMESKVRVTVAITALLRGPFDVGNQIIGREGLLEMLMVMAGAEDDELQQRVASEAIIAAASKKDKVRPIIAQGTNILKKLYASKNENIKVRGLVGLCKLGGSSGTDASIRPFADGSTLKLAEACRRFLINPRHDKGIRKWAIEGLSYLTLDAEVKERLIEDKQALQAMVEIAKSGDLSVVYGFVTTLVNLTNSYDRQEVIPEMIELAKFAKQHVPEEHDLDDKDFVLKRTEALAKAGMVSGLVALSKTDSNNCKELMARVLNAMCEMQELRGIVVQQGAAKMLLPIALEGTEKAKRQAIQALARIGITMNPEVAFPGQRSLEIVRPLIKNLHVECSALENFESLMCLTNLCGMNESMRQRVVREKGVTWIEHYLLEDHEMLKRAAAQCITNLMLSPDIIKMHEGNNDRIKLLLLLCDDEDKETRLAVAGALAIATAFSKKCCKKVMECSARSIEMLQFLVANPELDIQERGACILNNIISSSKELAEKIIETPLMELLMAVEQQHHLMPEDEANPKTLKYVEQALKTAKDWKLIKSADGGQNDGSDVE